MLRESKLSSKQSPVLPAAPDSSLGDSASLELRQAGACPLCLPNQAAFPLGFRGGDFSRLSAPCKGWKELRVAGLLDELGNLRGYSPAGGFHLLYPLAHWWVWVLYRLIWPPAEIMCGERQRLKVKVKGVTGRKGTRANISTASAAAFQLEPGKWGGEPRNFL